MAVIVETLRLVDGFTGPMRTITAATQAQASAMQAVNISASNSRIEIQNIYPSQKQVTDETQRTARASSNWLGTIRNVATALGGIALVKTFVQTADQMSQIDAKLRNITGSQEAALALQEQIYQSAQRSRAAYADTANLVARVGTNAREAFSNTDELVQFAENLNKSFVIAGATQQEQAAATLQLTQALASGVLRGEELNSVFEAAPNIIRTISDYLDVPIGQIREMASEGQITAEVVKNAMLAATDDINESFEDMPMTLAQAFQVGKNAIQQSMRDAMGGWSDFVASDKGQEILSRMISLFQTLASVGVGALQAMGNAALFVYDNLSFILPILAAIGVYLAIAKVQAMIAAGASISGALASAAAWAMNNWQVVLFIALLASLLIAAHSLGLGFTELGQTLGYIFGYIYAVGYNVFAALWNVIATFAEFFANVWNDPLRAVANLFFDVFDAILGIVETVASAIDALLGTSLSGAVSSFRGQMSSWVDETFGENAIQIKRMSNLDVGATASQWSSIGGNIGSKLDNMNFSLPDIAGNLSGFDASAIPTVNGAGGLGDVGSVGSVGSVKNIEGDVKLSDEDMKIYRDLAERRYMNNVELQTLAPQISVTLGSGANAKNLKPKDIANAIAKVLAEQQAAHTAVSHA